MRDGEKHRPAASTFQTPHAESALAKEAAAAVSERAESMQRQQSENLRLLQHRSFFGFAKERITSAPLYEAWQRLLAFFRRARLLVWIFRIATTALALIEAGTALVLSLLVPLLLLPPALVLVPAYLLAIRIEVRRTDRLLAAKTEGRHVSVLFFYPNSDDTFLRSLCMLKKDADTVVLVVSPYLFSAKGWKKGRFYTVLREEEEDVYLLRRYYLPRLRRRLLSKRDTTYVI